MSIRSTFGFLWVAAFFTASLAAGATQAPAPKPAEAKAAEAKASRKLTIANKPWTGDFEKMLERRMIRVIAPLSRSLYFNDRGRERGLAVELVRDWEQYLNHKYARRLGKRVGDVYVAEPNIHAGAKYMDQLMTIYFKDANFSEGNRPLFAFASYNCGPGNVAKSRREAAKRGLDQDKWFNHVEIVVAEKIGTETTTYVRNIYKYYVAYKLTLDAQAEVEKARREMASPKS